MPSDDHEREHGRIDERLTSLESFRERASKWGVTLAGAFATAILMVLGTIAAWLILQALGVSI